MNKALQNSKHEQIATVTAVQAFSGPLPHPDILRKYEEIVPGAAQRIIKMAEDQTSHRKDLESKVIHSNIVREKWGQTLGFIIAIVGLIVAGLVGVFGSAVAGGAIGIATLASLVGVFMYGSRVRSKERQEKDQD